MIFVKTVLMRSRLLVSGDMNPTMPITRRVIRDNSAVVSQHLSAQYPLSAAQLFDYLTSPEHLKNWFGKVNRDEFIYEIENNAQGRIESCKDHSFLITWELDGVVSFLNVEITEISEGVAQLAAGFSTDAKDIKEHSDEKYGSGATGVGWDLSLLSLRRYVSGVAEEPSQQEYAAFVADSAHAWGEADQASGVDPETTRKQSENTRRFYLGTEE